MHRFAKFVNGQHKYFLLDSIRDELSRSPEPSDEEEGSNTKQSMEAFRLKKQMLLERVILQEQYYKALFGQEDSDIPNYPSHLEEVLQGQEMLLHGEDRYRHPIVLWKVAQSLHRICKEREMEDVMEEGAKKISMLLDEGTRAIDLDVLDLELDFHCSGWQNSKILSLGHTVQLLDEWLVSIPRANFNQEAMTDLTSSNVSKEGLKWTLLQHFPRQLALMLYAMAVCVSLLIGKPKQEDEGISTHAEKLKLSILSWLSKRLLTDDRNKHEAKSNDMGGISALSDLLIHLSSHVSIKADSEMEFLHHRL